MKKQTYEIDKPDLEWIKRDREEVAKLSEYEILQEQLAFQKSIRGYENHLNCSKCLNRGYIPYIRYDDQGLPFIDEMNCECINAGKNLQRLEQSHIPTQQTFDTFKVDYKWQQNMFDKARDVLTNKSWFMALGQVGSGKTHICSAIVIDLIYLGANVKYFKWTEEAHDLTYNAHKPDKEELKTVDVLYIDDLFKGGKSNEPSNAEIKLFFEIVNSRYLNNKKTIISSEHPLDKLKEFDESTISRCIEKSGNNIVNIKEDNFKNYRSKHLR
jgi:DNA replication protein DnaC